MSSTETRYSVEPRNGLGLAAIILGVMGLLFGLVPLVGGFFAIGLGLTGMILGFAGRGRVKRGTATNRKTTWAGIVTSLLAVALGIFATVQVFSAVEEFGEDMEEIEQEFEQDLEDLEQE